MKEGYSFFERKRKSLSALFLIVCIGFALVTHHSWDLGSGFDIGMDIAGVLLVLAGVAGRVWSTLYIGGRKNRELVTKGPYSLTRNPLYFFSFIAGVGITLELENLYLIIAFLVAFPVYYHFVIKSEERRLAKLFPAEFEAYRRSTPAFFPRFSSMDFSGMTIHSAGLIKKCVLDGAVFLLMLCAAVAIEHIQEMGLLATLITVP